MSTKTKTHSVAAIRRFVHLLVAGALLSGFAYGEPGQKPPGKALDATDNGKIADKIDKARQDDDASIYYVEQIAEAKAVQAVPMLEEKFVRTKNHLDKAHIASALVRLGDRNEIYWDYLVKLAGWVIDAPGLYSYDSQGKMVPGSGQQFIEWAKAHSLSPTEIGEWPQYWIAGPVGLLGMTGDPRAVPVLRRGLLSPNHMVEIFAAKGLAEIGDEGSVPFMIEACKRAPPDAATAIAMSLVYFDDPKAQEAVDKYLPKQAAKLEREDRARGKKPFGD